MANAQQILSRKGTDVISIGPDATVLDAAQLMNDHHIGSLVVLVDGQVAGIVTERDVMRRVVAAQRDPATMTVREAMTTPVACANPRTTSDELRAVMRDKRIRHVPVEENGIVVGLVSIGDLNRVEQEVQDRTIRFLEQFMSVP
jgi:CBS domain-containing protein